MTHIDYVQYSIPQLEIDAVWEESHNRFYKYETKGEYGEKILRGHPNSDKFLVVASGKACSEIFSDISNKQYFTELLERGAKFSRIDIASDISYASRYFATVTDVLNACREKAYETSISHETVKFISSIKEVNYRSDEVETLYIGRMKKRGRNGIFRCYDKGLESGLLPNFLTRFEIEFRKDNAHSQAKRVANGWHLTEVMDNRIHFDKTFWYATLDNESSGAADVYRGAAKDNEDEKLKNSTYWAWAMQTMKGIGKRLADEDTERMVNLYRELLDSLHEGYNDKIT